MLISKLFGTKRAVGVGVGRSGKFRKQNTKVMYIKLPMYLFFMALGLNDFDAGKSISRAIERGGP
jgi:hypothetical protein